MSNDIKVQIEAKQREINALTDDIKELESIQQKEIIEEIKRLDWIVGQTISSFDYGATCKFSVNAVPKNGDAIPDKNFPIMLYYDGSYYRSVYLLRVDTQYYIASANIPTLVDFFRKYNINVNIRDAPIMKLCEYVISQK